MELAAQYFTSTARARHLHVLSPGTMANPVGLSEPQRLVQRQQSSANELLAPHEPHASDPSLYNAWLKQLVIYLYLYEGYETKTDAFLDYYRLQAPIKDLVHKKYFWMNQNYLANLQSYALATKRLALVSGAAGHLINNINNEQESRVRRRLESLRQLEEDWDSYGAKSPSDSAVRNAATFIRRVASMLEPVLKERAWPSSISPLPSGGIEVEWQRPANVIAVDVDESGKWGYLRKTGTGRGAQYDEGTDLTQAQLLTVVTGALLTGV